MQLVAELSTDAEVAKSGAKQLGNATVAAYHAFMKELPGLDFSHFQRDYTVAAAGPQKQTGRQEITHIDKPGDYYQSLEQDGLTRTWKTHVPPGYHGQPMPVVMVLHGRTQDGETIEKISHLSEKADQQNFIAVYPDAVGWFGKSKNSAWDSGNGLVPPLAKVDDTDFVKKVYDKTASQLSVSDDKLVAFSNGGMLAPDVIKAMDGKISAAVLVSSGINQDVKATGAAVSGYSSVLNLHGSNDPYIPVKGLNYVPDFANRLGLPRFNSDMKATKYWLSVDKISTPAMPVNEGTLSGATYRSPSGAEVADYIVQGGGHTWFGPGNGNSGADASVNATEMVIAFMNAHGKQIAQPKPIERDPMTANQPIMS